MDVVLAHLAERLADFKLPQYVVVTDEPLPRNPGGKLLKRSVREQTEWGPPRPRTVTAGVCHGSVVGPFVT